MRRIEKRLCIVSLIFVAIYTGAIVLTLISRTPETPAELKLESADPDPAVRHMVMAEVLPPMLVLLTLTICFVLVRKKQQLARLRMDALEEEDTSEKDTNPDSLT